MPQLSLPRPVSRVVDAGKRRAFRWGLRGVDVEPGVALTRLGSEWGGFTIPLGECGTGPICYCIGAGGDVTFDLELLERCDALIRCVDPFEAFGDQALRDAGHNPRFTFRQAALAATDGSLEMFRSWDGDSGTASSENIYRTNERFSVEARSLKSLMLEWGDDHIDLLKLNIEGSEYAVLESVSPSDFGIRILCIGFHHTSSSRRAIRILEALRPDYRVVHREDADVTLLRR